MSIQFALPPLTPHPPLPPLTLPSSPSSHPPSHPLLCADTSQNAGLLSHILDILSLCVERHTYLIKNCIIKKNVLSRVLVLMTSSHTYLALGYMYCTCIHTCILDPSDLNIIRLAYNDFEGWYKYTIMVFVTDETSWFWRCPQFSGGLLYREVPPYTHSHTVHWDHVCNILL